MKGLLIIATLAVIFVALCAAQTPQKPLWPNFFSATILHSESGRREREWFRWFYDASQNKDRWDGIVHWQGEPYFANLYFDHAAHVEYWVFYQPQFFTCIHRPLNRTIPRPDFRSVEYYGKGLIDEQPVYHWSGRDAARRVNYQVWDRQSNRRDIVRIDVDHEREHRAESFTFYEWDLTRQDPSIFTIPEEVKRQCNRATEADRLELF
eukprot:TRINITY_DN16_c0_g1_i2.p1 TRINITY_DN16_c0_g1~~TRINITY_DN16_c0_g1_i2.p1  ORF type:complete len:208 (-),score=36.93 TRINITY_DN16_c0_g1_i2:134-757(-)